MIGQEIEKVKDVWGSPMAGFFCLGEIGRSEGGSNDFHNYTSCLVILKEK
jgi:small ligand-binding sensory domain FIST